MQQFHSNLGRMLQCVAVRHSVLQCAAICCSVLQCVAKCCSVLRCVADTRRRLCVLHGTYTHSHTHRTRTRALSQTHTDTHVHESRAAYVYKIWVTNNIHDLTYEYIYTSHEQYTRPHILIRYLHYILKSPTTICNHSYIYTSHEQYTRPHILIRYLHYILKSPITICNHTYIYIIFVTNFVRTWPNILIPACWSHQVLSRGFLPSACSACIVVCCSELQWVAACCSMLPKKIV